MPSLRSGITSGLGLCIRPYRYASQLVRRYDKHIEKDKPDGKSKQEEMTKTQPDIKSKKENKQGIEMIKYLK